MVNASFLRPKNLMSGVLAVGLATGAMGQTALAYSAEDYASFENYYNAKAIEPGAFEFTKIDVKNNKIYAKAGEGWEVEWVRIAYRKNGERELQMGGLVNLVGFTDGLTEGILSGWGYKEMGLWTAFQAEGRWSERLESYVEGYKVGTTEKELINTSGEAGKLGDITERRLPFVVKEWKGGKEYLWLGEIDYSGCYLDECRLDKEKSSGFYQVFSGGEKPEGEEDSGAGGGDSGSGGTGGEDQTTGGSEGEGGSGGDEGGSAGGGGSEDPGSGGSGEPGAPSLPTTDPTDKDSELNLGGENDEPEENLKEEEEKDAEEDIEDESEEDQGEEKEVTAVVEKKPSGTASTKKAGATVTVASSGYSGVLSAGGTAISRASEADSSDDDDETDTDSDLGLETAYVGSTGLETPILGEGTGQKKGFSGWVWAGIAGLVTMGLGVVAWWFWPVIMKKKAKEGENGV